jgi:redox-sensitive bicupin YhaK (pirin superfamily)
MIEIRKSQARGKSKTNWLSSLHTFSFGEYYDPHFMNFGKLRVINEDTVQPGFGFGKHPHNDMEIISYVITGSLAHRDSMGNGSSIKPGEIQIMSAGTGIEHSESNHLNNELLHFLQIWIIPEKVDLTPRYQQITIQRTDNEWVLTGSPHKHETAITIHQDVNLYAAYLTKAHSLDYSFKENRMGWLQLIKGKIKLNTHELTDGDGAAIHNENFHIECTEDAELLFFDLNKE